MQSSVEQVFQPILMYSKTWQQHQHKISERILLGDFPKVITFFCMLLSKCSRLGIIKKSRSRREKRRGPEMRKRKMLPLKCATIFLLVFPAMY